MDNENKQIYAQLNKEQSDTVKRFLAKYFGASMQQIREKQPSKKHYPDIYEAFHIGVELSPTSSFCISIYNTYVEASLYIDCVGFLENHSEDLINLKVEGEKLLCNKSNLVKALDALKVKIQAKLDTAQASLNKIRNLLDREQTSVTTCEN